MPRGPRPSLVLRAGRVLGGAGERGAQDWRATSAGGREALPSPMRPPALRSCLPAPPPAPAPRLVRPSPVARRATRENFVPARGDRSPAAPHSPRREASSTRGREGGGGRCKHGSHSGPCCPGRRPGCEGRRPAGWHLPALPAPRVTRDRPRPACPPPPGAAEGCERPVSQSRDRARREQSLASVGCQFPLLYWCPFFLRMNAISWGSPPR